MHNELVTSNQDFRPTQTAVNSLQQLLAVADMEGEHMTEVMYLPKTMELLRMLQNRGVPKDVRAEDGDSNANIEVLANFRRAYIPTAEMRDFASAILAAVHQLYRAKQFGGEEFRRFYFGNLSLKNGDDLLPLPACLTSVSGTGFTLSGPSLIGKTAFLERISAIFPKPFKIGGPTPAPPDMWLFPVLRLRYPMCGTVRGLIRDMREQILAEVGSHDASRTSLPEMLAPQPENAAISACILLNVGLVIFDGAGFANANKRTASILGFLLKLRQSTGIPVVISCTTAFMRAVESLGTLYTNLFNGVTRILEPIEPPASQLPDGSAPVEDEGLWHQINDWFWQQGLISKRCPMPAELPKWTYEMTFGRIGWLAQGFESLHLELVSDVALEPGQLTEQDVKRIFWGRLQIHRGALKAMREIQSTSSLSNEVTFFKYLDYFPESVFAQPRLCEWFNAASVRRLL
jgi:hypothetical protein